MKVLVTGANGFLGSWLVQRLVQEGHEVSVLIREMRNEEDFLKKGITVFRGDVTQPDSLSSAFKNQQYVYHLAGLVAYSKEMRESLFRINADGTENILKQASMFNVQRVLLASSVVAVGASFKPKVLNEESDYTLDSYHLSYHESKRKAEQIVKTYVQQGLVDGVIVNPSTIYGAGDASKSSRSTQLQVARGRLRFYPPGGVSVVAIEDVVDGMVKAMEKGRSGERYILAGENLTLQEVFEIIAREANVSPPRISLPAFIFRALAGWDDTLHVIGKRGPLPSERALTAMMFHWYDSSKAKKDLGFSSRPAIQAIASSVQWMKDHKLLVRS